jgi:ABC-type multidrug transport system fused ATPase/permease subunit
VIAHRLSVLAAADRIVVLDNGQVVADGAYDELLLHSPHFRRLVADHDTTDPFR